MAAQKGLNREIHGTNKFWCQLDEAARAGSVKDKCYGRAIMIYNLEEVKIKQ